MDKISSLKKIFYLILISLFLYSAYWIYISFVFKNEVNNEIIRHGIQTQKIYVTGFPYRLEAHITNLSLEKEAENFFNINVPQIKISVSPFSFKKIFIQSNSSNLKYRSFTQNIDIFNKQGRLSIKIENGLIQRSTFMFEENPKTDFVLTSSSFFGNAFSSLSIFLASPISFINISPKFYIN